MIQLTHRNALSVVVAGVTLLPTLPALADPVEDLVPFTAGTTARADEVNGNFTEVADSVNDNDARIAALDAEIAELRAALEDCPTIDPADEMVRVGGICIDKYEASIWDAPVGGNQITGAIPCSPNGQDCNNIYARSVAGVTPRADITWFQAQQALANSGKRLPTNAEWQMAAAGTPDSTACNVNTGSVAVTGANADCVSSHDVNDMVGNLSEWVADWVPAPTACPGWDLFSDDVMCLAGASETREGPGALVRGGDFNDGNSAGPFALAVNDPPSNAFPDYGFRGTR